ncbi:MAG TPA: hypothetical protein VJZ72_08335 [Candidatus Limnocylindrales bacterium]|nr:hypothetical protein [Candidatus Limnocylindrales bacterium]
MGTLLRSIEIDDTTTRGTGGSEMPGSTTPAQLTTTLVWIDGERAMLARWDGDATVRRITAAIPPRRRSMGHVHRDPNVRHGGGGPVEDRIERARAQREKEFLAEVEAAIPPVDELVIIGPGVIREHLAHRMVAADLRHRRSRHVRCEAAGRLTEHQIVARLRSVVGETPPRRVSRPGEAGPIAV